MTRAEIGQSTLGSPSLGSPSVRSRGVTLLATVRNEAPFLLEWLAYHKVIGFTRFVIFSNHSTDGTTEILSALHEAGEINHIYHEPPEDIAVVDAVSQQAMASGHLTGGDWMIWLDADEFLNIHVGGHTTSDLIDYLRAQPQAQGICLSWRLFGTSGHDVFRGRFLCDDYRGCEEGANGRTNDKTFFLFDHNTKAVLNHKPLMHDRFWQEGKTFLGSNGQPMRDPDRYLRRWRKGQVPGRISREFSSWDIAQINHYAVRSKSLIDLKRARGRIAKPKTTGKTRYGKAYFKAFNQNGGQDSSILRWQAKTSREYARLVDVIAGQVDYFALIKRTYDANIVDLSRVERDFSGI